VSLLQPVEQIKLRGIKKSYGNEMAVQDVDLTVNPGDFLTILGPSGCGKTTCFALLPDLKNLTKGKSSLVIESFFRANKVCLSLLKNETWVSFFKAMPCGLT